MMVASLDLPAAGADVKLNRVSQAPMLNDFIGITEQVMQLLLDTLGKGTAQQLTAKALNDATGQSAGTGAAATQYHATDTQLTQYKSELNSLDTHIADIAQKSANITGQTRAEVRALRNTINGIIDGYSFAWKGSQPSIHDQLVAIDRIDNTVGKAEDAVVKAWDLNNAHGATVPQSYSDGGGSQGGGASPAGFNPALGGLGSGGGSNNPNSSQSHRSSSPGGATPASAQPISGGKKAQASEIYRYLITKYGFTPAQAAGILGNMQVESEFNTGAYNPGEGAIGLCQWEGGRRTMLERFAASQGKPVTDWQVQVDYMMREMQGGESGAYARLKATGDAATAASVFDQYYERSSGEARGQRMANAASIYSSMGSIAV